MRDTTTGHVGAVAVDQRSVNVFDVGVDKAGSDKGVEEAGLVQADACDFLDGRMVELDPVVGDQEGRRAQLLDTLCNLRRVIAPHLAGVYVNRNNAVDLGGFVQQAVRLNVER